MTILNTSSAEQCHGLLTGILRVGGRRKRSEVGSYSVPFLVRTEIINWLMYSFSSTAEISSIFLSSSFFFKSLSSNLIGSITSRCSGEDPALLPWSQPFFSGRDAEQTRESGGNRTKQSFVSFSFWAVFFFLVLMLGWRCLQSFHLSLVKFHRLRCWLDERYFFTMRFCRSRSWLAILESIPVFFTMIWWFRG